jgi:isopenicillin N synthase-like dioxygenase/uncharacterized protein with HEPN domain
MSDKLLARWLDVVRFCEDAKTIVSGKSLSDYTGDVYLRRATERTIELIAEAVVRLDKEAFDGAIETARWHQMRGLGNRLRHEYDDVSDAKIYEFASVGAPLLGDEARRVLTALQEADHSVPVMTFAATRRFPDQLYDALADTGFVVVTDHGIDLSRLHAAYAAVEAFFALPEAEKLAYMVGADGQRGYTPFGREHAKDSPAPDLKEFWHVGRNEIAPNVWPERPAAFEREVAWLYEALDELGLTLLRALTAPLGAAEDTFDEMARGGNSVLRLLHYPPLTTEADPRSIRAAAHEDINLITLLVSASAAGLELLDREGQWRAVEAPPDSVIVDVGDMLSRVTNYRLPATTHRVVNPEGPNTSRYSMPFFLHPRPDAMLSVFEGYRDGSEPEDITAGAFLRQRLEEIGLK